MKESVAISTCRGATTPSWYAYLIARRGAVRHARALCRDVKHAEEEEEDAARSGMQVHDEAANEEGRSI